MLPSTPYLLLRPTNAVAAAGGATTTWDPSKKNALISLSNGNLTASTGTGGSFPVVLGVAGHTTGKFYFELTMTTINTPGLCCIGVGNSSATAGSFLGNDANSIALLSSAIFFNGSSSGGSTYVQGDVIGIAVDLGAGLFWERTNAGLWNANGTSDPATGTAGAAFTITGTIFPGASLRDASDSVTANFGATAYANSAPAGFGNW